MKRFVSIFIVAILFLAACTKENLEAPISNENFEQATIKLQCLGKFQKVLTIYDDKKENSVVIRL
jgi:outer membrane biogenesis lipoprotein LolB